MNDNKPQSNDHKTHDSARDWYDYVPPLGHVTNYVTWNFNLDYPGGIRHLRECLEAPEVTGCVREFEEWLRRVIDCDEPTELEAVREELFVIFNRRGLSPWSD